MYFTSVISLVSVLTLSSSFRTVHGSPAPFPPRESVKDLFNTTLTSILPSSTAVATPPVATSSSAFSNVVLPVAAATPVVASDAEIDSPATIAVETIHRPWLMTRAFICESIVPSHNGEINSEHDGNDGREEYERNHNGKGKKLWSCARGNWVAVHEWDQGKPLWSDAGRKETPVNTFSAVAAAMVTDYEQEKVALDRYGNRVRDVETVVGEEEEE